MPGKAITRKPHRNQHPPALTRARQNAYLQALKETGLHRKACEIAQCAENMPFQWAIKNEEFRKRLEQARQQGEKILLAKYESSLDSALLDDCTTIENIAKVQNLRMFRMKKLDPSYRDNAQVNVLATGPVAIQFNIDGNTPTGSGQGQIDEKHDD